MLSALRVVFRRRHVPDNLIAFALCLSLGLVQNAIFLTIINPIAGLHLIFLLQFPLLMLGGPSIYFYYQLLTELEFKPGRYQLVHLLIPLCAAVAAGIEIYQQSFNVHGIVRIELLLAFLNIFAYVTFLFFNALPVLIKERQQSSFYLFLFSGCFAISLTAAVLVGLALTSESSTWFEATGAVLGASIAIIFVLQDRYPEFFLLFKLQLRKVKYKDSVMLRGVDVSKVQSDLESLMTKKQMYRQENLKLKDLSQQIGITSHQLSEVLNAHLKQTFGHFVNSYRVKEACEQLIANPQTSILAIAYSVGFNSKAAFQTAFQKFIGSSPSKYRARYMP